MVYVCGNFRVADNINGDEKLIGHSNYSNKAVIIAINKKLTINGSKKRR